MSEHKTPGQLQAEGLERISNPLELAGQAFNYRREVAMAHNAHGLSHDDLMRYRAIEQAAKAVVQAQLALETPDFLKALEALRAALEGK